MVQTRSSTRQIGIKVPKIFGKDKTLIPQVKPEHQAKQNLNIPANCSLQVSHQSQRPFRKKTLLDISLQLSR